MNSNRPITINKILCNYCLESFFELEGNELSECPHCQASLEQESSWELEESLETRIEVDFITGKLKVQ
jgi:uncharacterized paraquat-inducible protein A